MGSKSNLLYSDEDLFPSNRSRSNTLFYWKIFSILILIFCLILLIISGSGYFQDDKVLRFEGKISDGAFIEDIKENIKSAMNISQNILETNFKSNLLFDDKIMAIKNESHRKSRSVSNRIRSNLKLKKQSKSNSRNMGIYKIPKRIQKQNNLLKKLRVKRDIVDEPSLDPLDVHYGELVQAKRDKRAAEEQLDHLSRELVRCRKNTPNECRVIFEKMIKLVKDIRIKIEIMKRILENSDKYTKFHSLSTDEILFGEFKEHPKHEHKNERIDQDNDNNKTISDINDNLEKSIVAGSFSKNLTSDDKEIINTTTEHSKNTTEKCLHSCEVEVFTKQTQEKLKKSEKLKDDITSKKSSTTTTTTTAMPLTTEKVTEERPLRIRFDDGLLDYQESERMPQSYKNNAFLAPSAAFMGMCEKVLKENGFNIQNMNTQSSTIGITSPPTQQVTNRGFPVTSETTKATAQIIYNPNFGMPMYPICFFATPAANFRMPGQSFWSPFMSFDNVNNAGNIGIGTGPTGNGGFNPFNNGGFIFIPPMFGNIPQQGLFGHMTTNSGFTARVTPSGLEKTSQPYFCTYIPNDTPNVGSQYKMAVYNNGTHNQESLRINVPSRTDIVYATYVNRMGAHFDNILGPPDCAPGYVQCASADSQCIAVEKWCDSQVDCIDASDEAACSCKSRLPESKLCDGYPDCPLGEDEWGCFGCSNSEFSCYSNPHEYKVTRNLSTPMCYSRIEKCDGYNNCPNGIDEKECSMIVKSLGSHQSYSVSYTEGYLHRNYKGKWYPVCGNIMKWANEACEAEVDYLDSEPTLSPISGVIPGPFIGLSKTSNETILSKSCIKKSTREGVIIQVKCPEIKCGQTKQAKPRKRRSYPNENETTERLQRTVDRVVGGTLSKPLDWPFIVALYRDGKFYCGGIIYNKQWIITAAHCVLNYDQYYFEVKAGLLRRSSYGPMVQTIPVHSIIPHELYDRDNMKNDVALLYLQEPLLYNRWVRPICMPDKGRSSLNHDWIWGPAESTVCTAVGWGAVREKGPGSENLLQVDIPILAECKLKSDKDAADICAGEPNGGRDACQGDSGGPLFCRSVSDKNEWYLAGIVSHGEGCARPGEPGVYTRVALYLDWIATQIKSVNILSTRPLTHCPGFMCIWGGSKCIEASNRCNQIVDCLGGEDEVGCTYNHIIDGQRNNQDETTENIPSTTPINNADKDLISHSESFKNLNSTKIVANKTHEAFVEVTEAPKTITTSENFETTMSMNSEGIQAVTEAPQNNSSNLFARRAKFQCTKIPQKVDLSHKCDRIVDCEDGTDEDSCVCRDYLKGPLSILVCDGKIDCNDSTDEIDCGNCTKTQFYCPLSHKCIDKTKLCNGHNDCEFREDEQECFALTNGHTILLDANNRPDFHTSGIFTQNNNGVWEVICADKLQFNSKIVKSANDICIHLGFRNSSYFNTTLPLQKGIIPPVTDELFTQSRQSIFTKHLVTHFEDDGLLFPNKNSHDQIPFSRESTINQKFEEKIQFEDGCEGVYVECVPFSNAEQPFKAHNHQIQQITDDKNQKLPELKPEIIPDNKPSVFTNSSIAGFNISHVAEQILDKIRNKTKPVIDKLNSTLQNLKPITVPSSSENIYWPWTVEIFVDGKLRCIGILLDKSWVAVENLCFVGRSLKHYYVTALFGGQVTTNLVDKPYKQIIRVDCMEKFLNNRESNILLLHLERPVQFTRYVLPTFLPQTSEHFKLQQNDSQCLVVYHNPEGRLNSLPVKPIFDEELCEKNSTCFKILKMDNTSTSFPPCENLHSQLHAIIVCKDTESFGWYPHTFFSYNSNSCSDFEKSFTVQTLEKSFRQIQEIIDQNECKHIQVPPHCEIHRCPLGNCLLNESICNDKNDCHDGSDEIHCHVHKRGCEAHEFRCNNGLCIPKIKFCDHRNDCGDLTDEPHICSCFTYLQATEPSKICDGIRNCWDKSDEDPAVCKCTPNKFQCGSTIYCVPKDFVCDKYPDCPMGEDESFCYGIEYPSTYHGDGYGQVIEQSYGVWHTKCFPRLQELNDSVIVDICNKLGYNSQNIKPQYRVIVDKNNQNNYGNKDNTTTNYEIRSSNNDNDNKSHQNQTIVNDQSIERKYQTSTKAVVINKFSPLRLNKDFTLFMKPSRPIAQLKAWDENDSYECNRVEIKCE